MRAPKNYCKYRTNSIAYTDVHLSFQAEEIDKIILSDS